MKQGNEKKVGGRQGSSEKVYPYIAKSYTLISIAVPYTTERILESLCLRGYLYKFNLENVSYKISQRAYPKKYIPYSLS